MQHLKPVSPSERSPHEPVVTRWSGLRFRMTASYALVTFLVVLLLEILIGATIFILLAYGPLADDGFINGATQEARLYALAAAEQTGGTALDPRSTFEPDRPYSLVPLGEDTTATRDPIHYTRIPTSSPEQSAFAVLITPEGRVLASSSPLRFLVATPVAQELPGKSSLISQALSGKAGTTITMTWQGRILSIAQPVWSREKHIIGAVYVQLPELSSGNLLQGFTRIWMISGVFWLIITLPVGALFGFITTRSLLRRLGQLVTATTQFADGDYAHHVQVSRHDEIGQLEVQFNRMVTQLAKSMDRQQTLAGQNARLAERSRLARDLHDSIKQQLFALSMQLGAALMHSELQQAETRQRLVEADTLAYQIQQELTTLIQQLRPVALQDKGLPAALQAYAATWSNESGIIVDTWIAETSALSLTMEEALWRLTQEAFSNIARHSQASHVKLSLVSHQEMVALTITDNGQGFDQSTSNPSGIGLHSMRERVEELGGMFTIQSVPGEGTQIRARCPYAQDKQDIPETPIKSV